MVFPSFNKSTGTLWEFPALAEMMVAGMVGQGAAGTETLWKSLFEADGGGVAGFLGAWEHLRDGEVGLHLGQAANR